MQTSICQRFSKALDFLGDFVLSFTVFLNSGITVGIASGFNCNLKVFSYPSDLANERLKTKSDSVKCFSHTLECVVGLKYFLWHFNIQMRLKSSFLGKEKKAILLSLPDLELQVPTAQITIINRL